MSFIALGIVCYLQLSIAKVYYVSPSGEDTFTGTSLSKPLLTWQAAVNKVVAGDTIYIRSGIYALNTGSPVQAISPIYLAGVSIIKKSGTSDDPIVMMKYPDDSTKPVLQCNDLAAPKDLHCLAGILLLDSDHWHFKELEISHVNQPKRSIVNGIARGLYAIRGRNCRFEHLTIHHCGGTGLQIQDGAKVRNNSLVKNCDSHDNFDPYSKKMDRSGKVIMNRSTNKPTPDVGQEADGFAYKFSHGRGVRFVGCRAWNNSDDGWDLWQTEQPVVLDNCWAFWNGYYPKGSRKTAGNGTGLKLGQNDDGPAHIIQHCLVVQNRRYGIDTNGARRGQQEWTNNTSFDNKKSNFQVWKNNSKVSLKNNLSINRQLKPQNNFEGSISEQNNSWNIVSSISKESFQSLDTLLLIQPRKEDGALPMINLLKPAIVSNNHSSLVDQGIYVGTPYKGKAPDIGWSEVE